MGEQIVIKLLNLSIKEFLKQKKEKGIWRKAFISFLLEQKDNANFTPYSFEEIKKDAKLNSAILESFFISLGVMLCLFVLAILIKLLYLSFNLPHEDIIIKEVQNLVLFVFALGVIYVTLVNAVLTKIAIKMIVEYCNYYKINKTVVMFLVKQKLNDIQNNIFSLPKIKQYKLNREKTKPEETIKNTNLSANEDNGILNSMKSFFGKKVKEENQYDYLKAINYKLDYQEYLEHQEDKKSN